MFLSPPHPLPPLSLSLPMCIESKQTSTLELVDDEKMVFDEEKENKYEQKEKEITRSASCLGQLTCGVGVLTSQLTYIIGEH